MLMLYTTIGAALGIIFLFAISFAMEKFTWRRFTVKNISILGVLVALSVSLTNVIGYTSIFGFQIMLGNFVIFLTGMVFGPLAGVVTGLASDTVGSLINLGGVYHLGFMLIKILIGFTGALVFVFKSNRFWVIKMVVAYVLFILIHLFFLTPLFMWALYGTSFAQVDFIKKAILAPVQMIVYPFLTYSCFNILWILLRKEAGTTKTVWVGRNGSLNLIARPKKTEYQKLMESNINKKSFRNKPIIKIKKDA
ncbi:folate family ECF transporter S component [Mesoplasma syrphidae]|uniref:Folate family ECF transporter S component n=1 Tax=Mesoplasma syrphidae TaxID=225999 RepID=A0A2K9C2Z0_9MOLU|nr:folate family ECF transporter S component [Mesoplasma syrphidae]AUF83839.1 folate family ECF transporter S component [Mesoplasma syrphidae]